MQAMSLNFALAQKENTSFTTCKDQSESLRIRYDRYISYQWYHIVYRCVLLMWFNGAWDVNMRGKLVWG